jgi:hypothetical protein
MATKEEVAVLLALITLLLPIVPFVPAMPANLTTSTWYFDRAATLDVSSSLGMATDPVSGYV